MALVPGLLHTLGLWDSPERKLAEQDRQRALEGAQTQSDILKQLILSNQGIADNYEASLFGDSPEAIAQRLADEREALATQGGFSGTTASGRKGTFDFGDGGGASAETLTRNAAPQRGPDDRATINNAGLLNGMNLDEIAPDVAKALGYNYDPATIQNAGLLSGFSGKELFPEVTKALEQQRQAQQAAEASKPKKGTITADDRQRAAKMAEANYKNTLPGQLDASRARRQTAVDAFTNDVNGIKAVDAGDYDNAWNVDDKQDYISPEARAAQKAAMDKTFALTDTKETAEEKLMREVARRSQERDLRAAREAQASELRTRGAYGSGAELSGFLGSQQELAQRRSLEEMAANANAQKRAIDALGQYGNQAFQLGQQDTTVGGLRDLNSRFNSTSAQNFKQFKVKTQQEENDALAKRSASKLDAVNQQENVARGDIAQVADRKAQVAGMKTGANVTAADLSGQGNKLLTDAWNNSAANHAAKADADEDLLNF